MTVRVGTHPISVVNPPPSGELSDAVGWSRGRRGAALPVDRARLSRSGAAAGRPRRRPAVAADSGERPAGHGRARARRRDDPLDRGADPGRRLPTGRRRRVRRGGVGGLADRSAARLGDRGRAGRRAGVLRPREPAPGGSGTGRDRFRPAPGRPRPVDHEHRRSAGPRLRLRRGRARDHPLAFGGRQLGIATGRERRRIRLRRHRTTVAGAARRASRCLGRHHHPGRSTPTARVVGAGRTGQ